MLHAGPPMLQRPAQCSRAACTQVRRLDNEQLAQDRRNGRRFDGLRLLTELISQLTDRAGERAVRVMRVEAAHSGHGANSAKRAQEQRTQPSTSAVAQPSCSSRRWPQRHSVAFCSKDATTTPWAGARCPGFRAVAGLALVAPLSRRRLPRPPARSRRPPGWRGAPRARAARVCRAG